MKLPVNYDELEISDKWKIREEYIKLQKGLCCHCGEPLSGPASNEIMSHKIMKRLFPSIFFDHPVHLHHDHITGMTIGAIHCHCNAVLWQYHGI